MTHMYKAAVFSLLTIVCWAVSNTFLRYGVVEKGCNPFVLACFNVLFCGLTMAAVGSRNFSIKSAIIDSQTWIFGFIQIFRNFFMILAFIYVSATQANLLANVEIVFSLFAAWIVFKRRPGLVDFVAMLFILLGCFILVAGLPLNVMAKVTVFVGASAFLNVLRTLLAEIHKSNKSQASLRERLSATGWVLLLSAVVLVLATIALGYALQMLPENVLYTLNRLIVIPQPSEFWAVNNLLCGMVNGVCFYAISMFCYWYAVSLSNSEYFMMYRSTQAIFTYMAESTAGLFALLPVIVLLVNDWLAAVTIILSSACMVLMRTKRGEKLRALMAKAFKTI